MKQFLNTQWSRFRDLGWSEGALLAVALFVLFCIYSLIELVDEVIEGSSQSIDEWILLSLRRADDPALPVGPAWLREVGFDLTALGSPVVLILVVCAITGFLRLRKKGDLIIFTLVTTILGAAVAGLLKYSIARDRPDIVPHLREVTTPSFPSGHAMVSTIVYLTLGTLLMQLVVGRAAKLYCLLGAMSLAVLVGLSRIYLGVHYPTDVLAGWTAGTAWALGCWVTFQVWLRRKP